MHTVFICFLITFLSSPSTITANPEPSDLQLISEDFRILSRVTNAISLQASAIRKDIKVGEILSELLHVLPKSFSEIVNVDTKLASSELNRMHKEYFGPGGKKALKTERSDLADGKKVIIFLSSLIDMKQKLLNVSSVYSSDELHRAIQDITNQGIVNNTCSMLDYDNLDKFAKLFYMNFRLPEDNEIADIINKFKSQSIEGIRDCFMSLHILEHQLGSWEKVWKAEEKYREIIEVKKIAMKFTENANFLRELMNTKFKVLIDDIERTRPIWEGSTKKLEDVHKQIEKEMGNFENSVKTAREHIRERTYPLSTFTVGFARTEDLLKVFDDLKSPWFQKKIAKGANTKHLAKELQPFRNISQKILDLEAAWKVFITKSEDLLFNTGISKKTQRVKEVTNIGSKHSKHIERLEKSEEILKTCWPSDAIFDSSKFGVFEREQHSVIDAFNKIFFIQTGVKDFRNSLYYKIYSNEARISLVDDILQRIKTMEIATPKIAVSHRNTIENYITDQKERVNFLKTIERTAYISKQLNELKNASAKVDVNLSVDVKSILKDMKLIEIVECLENRRFGELEVEDTFTALIGITKIPNSKDINIMEQYLSTLSKVKKELSIVKKTVKEASSNRATNTSNHVLALNNSRIISESIGLCTKVLEDLERARQNPQLLLSFENFPNEVQRVIHNEKLLEWKTPRNVLKDMLEEANDVNMIAKKVRNGSVLEMTKVFEAAAKVHGIAGSQKALNHLSLQLDKSQSSIDQQNAAKYFEVVRDFDLDFAKYHAQLKNSHVTVTSLKQYFDEIFGHTKQKTKTVTIEKYIKPPLSWIAIVCICIGLVLLILIGVVVVYGFTENGRTRYKNIYLYYFGKPEVFEKRWRYACFMDKVDGKNALVDAVREVNKRNLLLALKRGAFVNAYNRHGNTALHAATKAAHPEFVKLLIKYGADRTLLNAKNRTAQQMIPFKYGPDDEDKKERFEECKVIFKKYKKKTYRISVPQEFPVNSFHIWMDPDTENKLTNQFMDKFPAITTDEAIPTTTHLVAKTDENGVWITDNLELLLWIFNGAIIVKEQWMADCVYDETLIDHDSKYLVENVKYKDVIYKSVLPWTQAMSKFTMPYLYGVFMHVLIKDYPNLFHLTSLVTHQGGIMLNSMPAKEYFNTGSCPYLHAHLGPIFLIHDGTMDLSAFKNDPDKMFTLFTEEEFVIFMLKREIHRDTSEHPIPVLKGDTD